MATRKKVEEVVEEIIVEPTPVAEYLTFDESARAEVADVVKPEDLTHLTLNDLAYAKALKG